MKNGLYTVVITASVLLILAGVSGKTCAQSGCGFKPFPPFGCSGSDAVCRCDDDGCQWIWYCN